MGSQEGGSEERLISTGQIFLTAALMSGFSIIKIETKMNKKILVGSSIIGGIIALFVFMSLMPAAKSEASVSLANDYQSTTTRTAKSGVALTNYTVLANTGIQQGTCTLGSVVITGANTGIIDIYDGTSTVSHADYATRTLATFPASTAAGTYTFDTSCFHGIVVEITGLAPTTTITYRP